MPSSPGRFALPVRSGVYYDSLSHSVRMESELADNLLLSGQEEKAIYERLFAPGPFRILLIPSFECNLRCPHCYVGHLLEKPSGDAVGSTDPKRLVSFVNRAQDKLGPLAGLSVVGGEPFLHIESLRHYIDAGLPVGVTTNGVFHFDDVKSVLGRLNDITFSVDGWPEQHNRTRKPLDRAINAFNVTYANICRTIETFPDLDVSVQGSIIDDDVGDSANSFRYFALMIAAGVDRTKIRLGPCAATQQRGAIGAFVNEVSCSTRKSPCCDHTLHKGFYVYRNQIYGSYYRFEEFPPIGTLDDDIEEILNKKKQFVMNAMPMLQDDVCMRECKAVGVCWGLCTNARHVFAEGKPSSVCDRAYKESLLDKLATECERGAALPQRVEGRE